MKKLSVFVVFSFGCLFLFAQSSYIGAGKTIDPFKIEIVKSNTYRNGAVASAHPLASQIGAMILVRGGNAFDAAVATQFALAVVYPQAGNLGGGGFITARKNNGELVAIDYREAAPSKAHRDMYLDEKGDPIERLSLDGHLASGVPGTVAGLFETMKYGRLALNELIDPAIALALNGFVLTKSEAATLNTVQETIKKHNTKNNAFIKKDWKEGDTLIQKDLAQTLIRIKQNGQKGFYEGKTAQLIVEEMQRGKGIISLQDLKSYKAVNRKPIAFYYRGYQIISFPPPSSGGLLIAQMLKMIEPYPVKSYGHNSVKSVHLMIEAERRAFADRAEYMGDPDFYNVPLKSLLDTGYLQQRMSSFNMQTASKSSDIHAGKIHESEQTTHLSVADKDGNIVSVTTTLNNVYGSKTVVGDAGFFLNDEMDDFSSKPGIPNLFGAIGGEANAIAPGKRMLSSMTPTLILKNDKPFMVVGSPGGTTIPTLVFQNIVNVIDFGMNAKQANEAPRFHHQWLPDEVVFESSFPKNIIESLEKMGHKIRIRPQMGSVETILFDSKGNMQTSADPRGDDSIAGF